MSFTPPTRASILADGDPHAADLRLRPGRTTTTRWRLVDTFPRDLWRRGELLITARSGAWRLRGDGAIAGPPLGAVTLADDLPDAWSDLRSALGLRALLPVADLVVAERTWVARNADDKIVARVLDQTWSAAPGSASAGAAAPAAARTLSVLPLRGYDLEAASIVLPGEPTDHAALDAVTAVLGAPATWSNKPALGLSAGTTAFDAARHALRTLIALARQTEPGLRADHDTEFLHDYRVLLRAARSVLSVFKGALDPASTDLLKAALKALANRTNTQRDLDVHHLAAASLRALVPDALADGLAPLDNDLARQRQRAAAALRRHLASAAYQAELDELHHALDAATPGPKGRQPLGRLAGKRVRAAVDAVRAGGRGLHDGTPAAEVHALRIEAKKLRYTLELLRDLYAPEPAKVLVKRLKGLQDVLGAFNDAEVQADALMAWASRARDAAPGTLLAVGALIGALHAARGAARAGVTDAFARFDTADLDALIDALTPEAP